MVSIGGWTGSRFFSTAVGSEANRTKFVGAIKDLVDRHNLGGVDLEYVLRKSCPRPILTSPSAGNTLMDWEWAVI